MGTPTATATKAPKLREPDEGDEAGVRVTIHVRVTTKTARVEPSTVAAFLPLRYAVANTTTRLVHVRINGKPTLVVGARVTGSITADGVKPGHIRISAGHGRRVVVRVKTGG